MNNTEQSVDTSTQAEEVDMFSQISNLSDAEFLSSDNAGTLPSSKTDEPLVEDNSETQEEVQELVEEQEQKVDEQEESEENLEDNQEESNEPEEIDWSVLTKPFKANGVDITIETPEEAIKLMQKGANYELKMSKIKAATLVYETMKEHNLTDSDTLNLLIEVKKGNKEAIAKILAEHAIDPLDLTTEDSQKYEPKNYVKDTRKEELTEKLNEIAQLPYGTETINMFNNPEWETSRTAIAENPDVITHIAQLKESGDYSVIESFYQKEMAMGNPQLNKLTRIEGIGTVYNYLLSQGKIGNKNNTQTLEKPRTKVVVKPETNEARKKASTTRNTPASAINNSANVIDDIANMTDEEFLTFMNKQKLK